MRKQKRKKLDLMDEIKLQMKIRMELVRALIPNSVIKTYGAYYEKDENGIYKRINGQ